VSTWRAHRGATVVSTWHDDESSTRSREQRLTREEARSIRRASKAQICESSVMVVVSGKGRETYAEIETALLASIPVLWVTSDAPSLSVIAWGQIVDPKSDIEAAILGATRPARMSCR
jgi:hypothetical protein